jgi:hypothetical protein
LKTSDWILFHQQYTVAVRFFSVFFQHLYWISESSRSRKNVYAIAFKSRPGQRGIATLRFLTLAFVTDVAGGRQKNEGLVKSHQKHIPLESQGSFVDIAAPGVTHRWVLELFCQMKEEPLAILFEQVSAFNG